MEDEEPIEISVEEAQRRRTADAPSPAMLLDVREEDEWNHVHVEGSKHIPMGQISQRVEELPQDRPLLVLCHHGGRSMRVTQYLRARGFRNAVNVRGGIDQWAQIIDPSLPRY